MQTAEQLLADRDRIWQEIRRVLGLLPSPDLVRPTFEDAAVLEGLAQEMCHWTRELREVEDQLTAAGQALEIGDGTQS